MRVIQVALSLLILMGAAEAKGIIECHTTHNEIVELLKMLSGDTKAYRLEWQKFTGATPRESFENDHIVRSHGISQYNYFSADLNAVRRRISKGILNGCAPRYHYDLFKMNVVREVGLMRQIGERWWIKRRP